MVRFTLLDPPSMQGSTSDQLPKDYMISTDAAINLLKSAIDDGKFVVNGGDLDTGNVSSHHFLCPV